METVHDQITAALTGQSDFEAQAITHTVMKVLSGQARLASRRPGPEADNLIRIGAALNWPQTQIARKILHALEAKVGRPAGEMTSEDRTYAVGVLADVQAARRPPAKITPQVKAFFRRMERSSLY